MLGNQSRFPIVHGSLTGSRTSRFPNRNYNYYSTMTVNKTNRFYRMARSTFTSSSILWHYIFLQSTRRRGMGCCLSNNVRIRPYKNSNINNKVEQFAICRVSTAASTQTFSHPILQTFRYHIFPILYSSFESIPI